MRDHLGLARQWIDGSRPDLAERELRRHLAIYPQDGAAHALLALALISLRRGEEALAAMREAARLDPLDPDTVQAVAEVHVRRGRPEAESAVRAALALFPAEPTYHALLAAALMQRTAPRSAAARLNGEALEAAEAGLALDPSHPECLLQRAQALLRLDATPKRAPRPRPRCGWHRGRPPTTWCTRPWSRRRATEGSPHGR
jgi:tetratricopeptide (TPR) repeat protein